MKRVVEQKINVAILTWILLLFTILSHSGTHLVAAQGNHHDDFPTRTDNNVKSANTGSRLLLISFDGFRWDYLDKFKTLTPNFQVMRQNGVYARRGIKGCFETLTIPNHYSLVTGLYPESHGMVSNEVIDPELGDIFVPEWFASPDGPGNDHRYYDQGGEPIWVTNQMQKAHGRSGSVMWFGGDNTVKGIRPSFHVPFDDDMGFEERVNLIIKWLTQDHDPINLGLIFFPEPDYAQHYTGLDSDHLRETIARLDASLGYLFQKLDQHSLLHDTNIIATADHGFASMPKEKYIFMDEIVPPDMYSKILFSSPIFSVVPKRGMQDKIYSLLRGAADKPNSHFKVYKKGDIPDKYHLKNNRRVQPFLAIADLEFSFIVNKTADEYIDKAGHGYDNDHQEMRPFFVGMGPGLKKNLAVDSFNLVDVYPLMCRLLNLRPAPNNGSLEIVSSMLVEGDADHFVSITTAVGIILVVLVSFGVYLAAVYRHHGNVVKSKTR